MSETYDMTGTSDAWCDLDLTDEDLQNIFDEPLTSQCKSELRTREQHAGFDNNVGDTWLYPNNFPERAYQLNIVKASLFNNTLVVLPTGLGKTFIAAVVMYNIYRWYPASKVIFMAPTRPLVGQQIEACQRVMPFPDEETCELTGRLPRVRRAELWKKKRVFFATPQVVQSDICSPSDNANVSREDVEFPFNQIKLIVVDEAHRAKGRYAYNEVVQLISQQNKYFRVLALSATPGRTMDDIIEVVRNLLISHIEVRCDTSIDVMPYVHRRNMKTLVVPLSEDLKELHAEVLTIVDPYLRQLIDANVLSGSLTKISRNYLLFEQKRFRERSQIQNQQNQAAVLTNFSFCISMYHGLELLERHGMRVFQNYFEEDGDGRSKFVVNMEPKLRRLLDRLRKQLGPNPFEISTHPMTNGQIAKVPSNLDFGHPKFDEARHCLIEHFKGKPDSRAIVFCEYRESVMLIFRLLLQHMPLLKPRYFVGQGGNGGSLRPLTQKEQIQIMQDFRSGKNNILVATSVGEEGIDVGEVELIVCFDINTSNPRRFIQRIGRTGRQKQGSVVVLVTEGREEQVFKEVLAQKNQTNAKIKNSIAIRQSLYKYSPRLVPTELDPKVVHVFIKPPTKEKKILSNTNNGVVKKLKKRSKEKELKSSQDLRTFFKKKTSLHLASMVTDATQRGLQTQEKVETCLSNIDDYFKAFEAPTATNTQLLDTKMVSQSTSPTFNEPRQKSILDCKLLGHLKKLVEKKCKIIPSKELITDPIEQIKSQKVSDDGKRFILRSQPYIVSDVLEKFKVLEVLSLESDEMSTEEKDIRNLYCIIEKLLGGTRLAVEMFIDDIEIGDMARKHDVPSDICDMSDGEYKSAIDKIFDGLDDQGILCDNFDYIQEEFKNTEFYKVVHPETSENNFQTQTYTPKKRIVDSIIYDTVALDEDIEFYNITDTSIDTETTFQNQCQWNDFAKNAPLANKSTPLGPLAKAFQRQQKKIKNTNFMTCGSVLKRLDESFCKSIEETEKEAEVILISESESIKSPASLFPDLDIKEKQTSPTTKLESIEIKNDGSPTNILSELDMEAFLEPFPEQSPLSQKTKIDLSSISQSEDHSTLLTSSQKENKDSLIFFTHKKEKNTSTTQNDNDMSSSYRPITPPSQPKKNEIFEKSPSLYEMYLKNVRKRSKLPEHIKHSVSFAENEVLKALTSSFGSDLSSMATANINDDKIISIASPKSTKRKYISSSDSSGLDINGPDRGSETECEDFAETQINKTCINSSSTAQHARNTSTKTPNINLSNNSSAIKTNSDKGSESECEEIAATQKVKRPPRLQRQRRGRLHEFIDAEAGVSGKDESDDEEDEMSCSQYIKDSIVVSSDDIESSDDDAPTATQMQAHYLQTVKSPRFVPLGAFKIPEPREFNDRHKVYSQTAHLIESQYVCDSFVVHEDDIKETSNMRDQTMSPLERAERILKKRRTRKKFKEVAKVQKRRRIFQPVDSSDDEN